MSDKRQALFSCGKLLRCLTVLAWIVFAIIGANVAHADDLVVVVTGTGQVTEGTNINCVQSGANCTHLYDTDPSTTVTLLADPGLNARFDGWGGNCSGSGLSPNCTLTIFHGEVSGTVTVTAAFVATYPLSVSLAGTGSGQVSEMDGALNCPSGCLVDYDAGTTQTLAAVPDSGSLFFGWSGGGCTGTGTCSVSMSMAQMVTATFELDSDQDSDGVLDHADACANTPGGESVNSLGCSSSQLDADSDGVNDNIDLCPATPANTQVNADGCADSQLDSDGDNVTDDLDLCPLTPANTAVNANGCATSQLDADNDGVSDNADLCPATPANTAVNADGCATSQLDTDSDGVTDDIDLCPATPANEAVNADGCAASQLDGDDDEDGVRNSQDQCPATPANQLVDQQGCSPSQLYGDDDGDDVANNKDQCPSTPQGEAVNVQGCSASQLDDDDDLDSVVNSLDQCPDTPSGEVVNTQGCSASQLDEDEDGVADQSDQCPMTPAGETVDALGCGDSQVDADDDGVANADDQCPQTPVGEAVNAVGCGDSQLDADQDGVIDSLDQCPATPTGSSVNTVGCSALQLDGDGDGVADTLDQCPDTAAGDTVNEFGCSAAQTDSDGDGVADSVDTCADTPAYVAAVDAQGCPAIAMFGNDLGNLPGIGGNERVLGSRIDEICPMLLLSGEMDSLSQGEMDLRDACLRIKNLGTTEEQAAGALNEISLSELASQKDYAVEISTTQNRHLGSRMGQVKGGTGGGVSVTGLNIGIDGQQIPDYVLQSALEGILGMGASGDSMSDFGKLGIFIQGDLDFGERDQSALEAGYEFDAWSLTTGVDYRFTDNLFAGASISLGEVEMDYDSNRGSSDISNWTVSLYGGWQLTPQWYVDGLLSYGESDFDTSRDVRYQDTVGAFVSTHRGATDGDQLFVGLNTGYVMNRGAWRFGPTASVAYLDGSIDGFTETSEGQSSQAWNFMVEQQDYESLRLSVGLQADYVFSTSYGVFIPGVRASYVTEQEDGPEHISLKLVNNPFSEDELLSNQIFVATDGRDSTFMDVSLNLSGQFIFGFSGFVSYQFYSAYDNYSQDGYTLGLRWDKAF